MQEPAVVDSYKETVFQTQQGSCTYVISVSKGCTRAVQAEVRQHPSTERCGGHEVLPQGEESLTNDSC